MMLYILQKTGCKDTDFFNKIYNFFPCFICCVVVFANDIAADAYLPIITQSNIRWPVTLELPGDECLSHPYLVF